MEVKNKYMLIILDNADDFFMFSQNDFEEELETLRK